MADFLLMVAPLQGLTEAEWRSTHFDIYGREQGDVEYFTPFIRVEKGEVRGRDMRDFTSSLNEGMNVTPQIIFRDAEEWQLLVDTLVDAGAERIDMNLGCPFVPQVRKGRGAGMLLRPDELEKIARMVETRAHVAFSVKMRLGVNDASEAIEIADILNGMSLRHVTIHPRTARQQYKGALELDAFEKLAGKLRHKIVFNGEIRTPEEITEIASTYDGVMVGRGLLARPSLFAEWSTGIPRNAGQRGEEFLRMIERVTGLQAKRLCGQSQLRDKMRPYWEYAPDILDRKLVKAGKKHGIIQRE